MDGALATSLRVSRVPDFRRKSSEVDFKGNIGAFVGEFAMECFSACPGTGSNSKRVDRRGVPRVMVQRVCLRASQISAQKVKK